MGGTILITGVSGFLGRHAAREFLRRGWRVCGIDDVPAENSPAGIEYRRLRLPDPALEVLLETWKPDACVHAAGRASVPLSMSDPAADFHASPVLTFELLETLRRVSPRTRVAFLSSAAVYGDPESLPITEEHATRPMSPYGYHKRLGELLIEEYARIFQLSGFSVRIFSAYGVGLRRQVVWDICERALTTGRLTLRGTGNESRDFIHASDVVRALATLLEKADARGEVYNVAAGEETTIAEIAQTLLQSLGLDLKPEFDGKEVPGNPHRWRADITRLAALGYTREVRLEQGLNSVAQWALAEIGAPGAT